MILLQLSAVLLLVSNITSIVIFQNTKSVMCKQLLGIGACANVGTSRLASSCWRSEGYGGLAAVDLKV